MAETNAITRAQIAKVREVDFTLLFTENVKNLIKMLGVTRKISVTAGTVLKVKKVTGTLQSGMVGEGEIIPLSQYQTTWEPVAEATLNKWRKATTAEAMLKGGYDQAVNDTNRRMILDVQKGIRTEFLTNLATGTGTAAGTGLQQALANAWGKMQVLFEDDAVEIVSFVNPMDVSDYLGNANITVQTAFGMNYIEDFLGMGTVIMSGTIPVGTFYTTAKENIVCYYINVSEANGIGEAFDFTTDSETGFIGVHEEGNYTRMQEETVAVSGITFFAERPDGVLVGTIGSGLAKVTVSPLAGTDSVYGVSVGDIQSGVSLANNEFTGSSKYLSGSNPITDVWGEGNFLAVTFNAASWSAYTSVKVGLEPSAGAGMVELIGHLDDLDSVFKITDKNAQKLKIVATNGTKTTVQAYSLAKVDLEGAGEG